MKQSMLKAWLLGACTLLAIYLIWFLLLKFEIFFQAAVAILWAAPAIAAMVSAYASPSKKILLGVSLAIPSALLAVTLNTATQLSGSAVDFQGNKGGLILFVLTLITASVLATAGSLAGYFLSKNRG